MCGIGQFIVILIIQVVWSRYKNSLPMKINITDFGVEEVDLLVTLSSYFFISNGSMTETCDDILFLKAGTNETIPYWIESGCGENVTHIWIRLHSPPFGELDIWMFYNDPYWEQGMKRNKTKFVGNIITPTVYESEVARRIAVQCPEGSELYTNEAVNRYIRIDNDFHEGGFDDVKGGKESHVHSTTILGLQQDLIHSTVYSGISGTGVITYSYKEHSHSFSGTIDTMSIPNLLPYFIVLLCVQNDHESGMLMKRGNLLLSSDPNLLEKYPNLQPNIRLTTEYEGHFPIYRRNYRGFEGLGTEHVHLYQDAVTTQVEEDMWDYVLVQTGGYEIPNSAHQHSIVGNTFEADRVPPFRTIIFYEVLSPGLEGLLEGTFVLTNNKSIPMGWEDYTAEYHGKYLQASNDSYEKTGGSHEHFHEANVAGTLAIDCQEPESPCEDIGPGEGVEVSNSDHFHSIILNRTNTALNNPPYINFALMKRKKGDIYEIEYESIVEYAWECFQINSESDRVCSGNGDCSDVDQCECNDGYNGILCQERIAGDGYYFTTNEIYISWEVDVIDIQIKDERMTDRFDCSILIDSPSMDMLGEKPECTWKNLKLTRTSHLVVLLDPDTAEDKIDVLSVIPINSPSEVVSVHITPYVSKNEDSETDLGWIAGITVPTILCFLCCQLFICCLGLFLMVCCVFLLCGISSPFLGSIYLRQRKGLEKLSQIDGIDILLKEQEFSKDHTVAKLNVNKRLFEVQFSDIEILEKLNVSSSSNAQLYRVMLNKAEACFKCFNTGMVCSSQNRYESFEREVSIMSTSKHPSLIRFFGAVLKEPRIGILMEFCHSGDIKTFMETFPETYRGAQLENKERIRILKEISEGVCYLHERNIIHRDLKPSNILLTNLLESRIVDFGLSKAVEKMNEEKTKKIGTSYYMAPEVVRGDDYDSKCDVFSYGVLMFETICSNFEPFGRIGIGEISIEFKIANDPTFRPVTPRSVSLNPQVNWTIPIWKHCWNDDPKKRPSFEEIRESLIRKSSDNININNAATVDVKEMNSEEEEEGEDRESMEKKIKKMNEVNVRLKEDVKGQKNELDVWKTKVKKIRLVIQNLKEKQ